MSQAVEPIASPFRIRVSIARFTRLLAWTVAALLLAHLVLQITHYTFHPVNQELKRLLDLDEESNFPSWYSWTALLLSSAILFVIVAVVKRRMGDKDHVYWFVMAAGFLYLSLDEDASIHEILNGLENESGHPNFSWTYPAMILVAVLGVLGLRFLWRLPARYRWLFLGAAFAYLAGAVGMEWIGHAWLRARPENTMDSLTYNLLAALEELLEMSSIVVFIGGLLSYARATFRAGEAALATPLAFRFPGTYVTQLLAAVAAALVVFHIAIRFVNYRMHEVSWVVQDLFNLGQENNVPAWFAAALMLLAATLCALVAGARRRAKTADAGSWLGLALILGFLSLAKDANLPDAFETFTGINWTIPSAIAAVIVVLAYWKFVSRLPAGTRRGFMIAAALYLAGALGVEWVALKYFSIEGNSADSLAYGMINAAKQTLEMSGMLVMIGTLVPYMSAEAGDGDAVPVVLEVAR